MPVGAGIAAVSAVGGAYMSSEAAKDAAETQADATQSAADSTWRQFNTINQQQAPYRDAGYSALNLLRSGFGITTEAPGMNRENFDADAYVAAHPDVGKNWWTGTTKEGKVRDIFTHWQESGADPNTFTGNQKYNEQLAQSKLGANAPGFGQFTHQFDANDLKANLAPNYDFMLKQGQGQTGNYLNSTAGLVSGNAAQGLNTFTQNFAKNAYQDAFNNYTTNQNNIYSRLAGLAGIGQNSLQQSNAAGMNATNSANEYLTSGAAAQAAGRVGQANAWSNGLSDAGGYYALSKMV